MNSKTEQNKRIAKNTLFLYLRLMFSMLVGFYTSRVILNAFGVEDYGLYGVVGGIVAFFKLISGSLSGSISRFITYEIGKGRIDRLNRVFCTSVNIQFFLSLLLIILAETIGLWFLNTQMNIPEGRTYAAQWVYQCSIFSFVVGLLSVPYNATIIAHEHMGAFAYLGIISTFLNLGVALLISYAPFDKLIFYALLILGIEVLMRLIYGVYCKIHFEEAKWHWSFDKSLTREMTSFAGWSFLGASSGVLLGQGINILMNIFFGVVINAARNIATNVEHAVGILVNNFTTALNPQITKSYAAGDLTYMHDLVCKGAKYSFFIMFIVALPILLETHIILILWLKQIPEYAVTFTRLAISVSLISVLSQTLVTSMLATGKIKKYQIIISSLSYSIFILAYVSYKIGMPPTTAYIIQLIIFIIQLGTRMILLRDMIQLPLRKFTSDVLFKVCSVLIVSSILPFLVKLNMEEGILRLIVVSTISVCCASFGIYTFGLSHNEQVWIRKYANSYLQKFIGYR